MLRSLDSLRGPGVYLLYDDEGSLLYVGKTVDARRRLSCVTSQRVASSYLLPVAEPELRDAMEALLISRLDPPCNAKGAPTKARFGIYEREFAPDERRPVTITLRLPGEVYEAAQAMAAARRTSGEKVGEGASILGVVCDAVMSYREKETR